MSIKLYNTLSKEIEDELAKMGNIETEEEAREKWRKMNPIDAEKESQRQKEKEERRQLV